MKIVGFMGAYDKTDLIIYISKLLTTIGKKVLVIDATVMQKAKYIVPTIFPAKSYVTEFEDIDVAVGLYSYNAIKKYFGIPEQENLKYDYILIDTDSVEAMESFNIKSANKNYFVTGFDAYSIKKGLEILKDLPEPINLKKILFSKNITKEEDDYLNYLSLGSKAIWDEEQVYFPIELGDQTFIIENQMASKLKFKKFTELYRESLIYIVEELLDDKKEEALVRKAYKQLEKGV